MFALLAAAPPHGCGRHPVAETPTAPATPAPQQGEAKKAAKPRPRPTPEAPAAESTAPRLLDDARHVPDDAVLKASLERAEALLVQLRARKLDETQQVQVASAQGFVDQAREALAAGDKERASTLLEKSLVLLQDIEAATRT